MATTLQQLSVDDIASGITDILSQALLTLIPKYENGGCQKILTSGNLININCTASDTLVAQLANSPSCKLAQQQGDQDTIDQVCSACNFSGVTQLTSLIFIGDCKLSSIQPAQLDTAFR